MFDPDYSNQYQGRFSRDEGYFRRYEGGYTNKFGSANDAGKRRLKEDGKDEGKKSKKSKDLDLSTIEDMIKFNQQAFDKLSNDTESGGAANQDGMKKCIERQQMLMEMKVEMMKSKIKTSVDNDDPMEGCSEGPQHRTRGANNFGPPRRERGPHSPMMPFGFRGRPDRRDGNTYDMYGGRGGGPTMRGRPPMGFGPQGRGREFYGGAPFYPSMDMMTHDEAPSPIHQTSIEQKLKYFKEYVLEHFDQLGQTSTDILFNCKRAIEDPAYQMYLDYKTEKNHEQQPVELTGRLKINSIFLAKSVGVDERAVKESVFSKALYALYTKTVSEIFYLSTSENAALAAKNHTKVIKHYFVTAYCNYKLSTLIRKLPKTDNHRDVIRDFDYVCDMNGITVTSVLYREQEDSQMMCDLYVDDCHLGTGVGTERKDAIKKAYIDSKAVLENGCKDQIVNDHKRLSGLDRSNPNIIDIINRGRYYEVGSNAGNLISSGIQKKYEANPQKELVVLIQYKEREPVPYKVLETTATANGLKLEYVLHCSEKNKETKEFRCLIFLNSKFLSSAVGQNKPQAKFNSAEAALKELTCRYSLIEYPTRFYKPTTSNDKLAEMSCDLQASLVDISQVLPRTFNMEKIQDELDPYIYLIMENLVQDYASRDLLDELIFGPDISQVVVDQLLEKSKEFEVDCNCRQLPSGLRFLVFQKIKRITTLQMSDHLLTQSGFKSGRYTLIHLRQPKGKIQHLNQSSRDTSRYLTPKLEEDSEVEQVIPCDLGIYDTD